VLLSDVDWRQVGVAVAGAAVTTLVRVLLDWLPETSAPLEGEVVDGVATITAVGLLTAQERDNLTALRDALEHDDPGRAALSRVLSF
jgi:hypothetical protein